LNNDSCAFLVQVPELRNYTAEAKSALADQSWFVANSVLISHDYEPGFKLGVGTRGKVIYQRIDIGEVSANATLKLTDGVKSSVGGLGKYTEQFLGQFFEE